MVRSFMMASHDIAIAIEPNSMGDGKSMSRISSRAEVFLIGGGPTGLAAAIAARKKGLAVIVADGALESADPRRPAGNLRHSLPAICRAVLEKRWCSIAVSAPCWNAASPRLAKPSSTFLAGWVRPAAR